MSLLDNLIEVDHRLFAYLNRQHLTWLDQPMFLVSTDWFWMPMYGFFIFLIIKRYRKRAWLPVAFIFIGVLLSDQISNNLKKTIRRPRPTHHVLFEKSVHIVNNYKGGNYGFISSHAANTFCIASMLVSFLYLRNFAILFLLFWATLVCYSRIYLGVHFPADIVGGASLGIAIAVLLIIIKKRIEIRLFSKS